MRGAEQEVVRPRAVDWVGLLPAIPVGGRAIALCTHRITVLSYLQNLTLIFERAQVLSEGSCGYSKKRLEFLIFFVRSDLFFDEY